MDDLAIFFFAYAIGAIIMCCIFGAISKHINESKGYYGGFAWGFFLGVIGIIVVACRSDAPRTHYSEPSASNAYMQPRWECAFCGRENPGYKTLCDCGRRKNESEEKMKRKSLEGNKKLYNGKSATEIQLEGAKRMLDDGLINEEEYEAKRKRILGLE